eukprot:XP_011610790.1 PREDICTED: transmembrane protein 132C-like [Takifugu rubripes]
MAVIPQSWRFLPLTQAELGPLFSNSSPFSFSQSLFIVPPHHHPPPASLRASFGPYSVTQLLSEPALPPSHLLSASLLSEHVERERDAKGRERFTVRVLFHKWGDSRFRRTCITLHAFKETEEHRASCMTQPPLGLCVVTLTLPSDWFRTQPTNQSNQVVDRRQSVLRYQHKRHNRKQKRHRSAIGKTEFPQALRYERGSVQKQVQLYYSSSSMMADLDLEPQGCVEDRTAPSQQQLIHIKAVMLKESEMEGKESRSKETCLNGREVEELGLDTNVLIRYHRGLVLTGQPLMVSVNLRANLSAEVVIIRLKVKKNLVSVVAHRSLTPDLWDVTLEKSQDSSHDVVSIICRKHGIHKHPINSKPLHQVACLTASALKGSFGVAMAVPCGLSNMLINTAILTNQPASLAVMVLAISHDEKVYDVTSAATCYSADENTVTSNCSAIFVDGSESGLGSTCAKVEFVLGTLRGSVCLEVWAPSVPLQVSLSDPVLNAINGWNHITEKGCVPVYQRSSIQVLTQFTAQDSNSRTTHLLGSPDWFVDVTELVLDLLRIEDPHVASFGPQKHIIGLQPGKTSLHVISEQWDGILGRCEITVTTEPVNPGDLSVQVVSDLGMSVTASPAHPFITTVTVTAYNILYNHQQEASVNVWLQFSDDTASLLSSFSDLPHFLSLSSLAETVVVVPPGQSQRAFAQGDGGGPLLFAELLISICYGQQATSSSVNEGDETGSEGSRTRMLAKGSGWIRVNLDLGFLPKTGEGREFDVDIPDILVESNGDLYVSNNYRHRNVSSDYKIGKQNNGWNKVAQGETVYGKHLERAVQMPGQEEGAVYFSSSHEKKQGWTEDSYQQEDAHDLEVGVAAVLSLLGIFAVLFLANFLPSALRATEAVGNATWTINEKKFNFK